MGLGGVAIATLPSVIFPKLMFSDRLGGDGKATSNTTLSFCTILLPRTNLSMTFNDHFE